jgi:hypothetical protein
LPLS